MAQIEQDFSHDWVNKKIKEVDTRSGEHAMIDFKDTHSKAHGLRLRINPGGKMTFYISERIKGGNPKKITVGDARKIPLVSARGIAKEKQELIANGKDPAIHFAVDAEGPAIREIFQDKIAGKGIKSESNANGYSRGTLKTYRSDLNNLHDLADKKINTITDKEVLKQHQIISLTSGARAADRAMVLLRNLGNYAIKKYKDGDHNHIVTRNPADAMAVDSAWNVAGGNSKRRGVAVDQLDLKPWWEAIESLKCYEPDRHNKSAPLSHIASYYFRFLLVTGLRPGHAAKIEWANVNLKRGVISFDDREALEKIKNAKPMFNMPLSSYALQLLKDLHEHRDPKCPWVFPNESGSHVEEGMNDWIKKLRKITGFEYHANDMRSTFLTIGECCGINTHSLKRLANHTQKHSDVTSGYIVANVEHLRTQSQLITNFILEEIGKESSYDNDLALSQDLLEWSVAKSKETGDTIRDVIEGWARTGRLAEQFPTMSLDQIKMIQCGA